MRIYNCGRTLNFILYVKNRRHTKTLVKLKNFSILSPVYKVNIGKFLFVRNAVNENL
jgi:hypothetical protein